MINIKMYQDILSDGQWLAVQADRGVSRFVELASRLNMTQVELSEFWKTLSQVREISKLRWNGDE